MQSRNAGQCKRGRHVDASEEGTSNRGTPEARSTSKKAKEAFDVRAASMQARKARRRRRVNASEEGTSKKSRQCKRGRHVDASREGTSNRGTPEARSTSKKAKEAFDVKA